MSTSRIDGPARRLTRLEARIERISECLGYLRERQDAETGRALQQALLLIERLERRVASLESGVQLLRQWQLPEDLTESTAADLDAYEWAVPVEQATLPF